MLESRDGYVSCASCSSEVKPTKVEAQLEGQIACITPGTTRTSVHLHKRTEIKIIFWCATCKTTTTLEFYHDPVVRATKVDIRAQGDLCS